MKCQTLFSGGGGGGIREISADLAQGVVKVKRAIACLEFLLCMKIGGKLFVSFQRKYC